eukprot:4064532-Lingulodinium_polyedra.AAC.1
MEQAGIHRLFAEDFERATELLGKAGIPGPALRQQPFLNWMRGRAGCSRPATARGSGRALAVGTDGPSARGLGRR